MIEARGDNDVAKHIPVNHQRGPKTRQTGRQARPNSSSGGVLHLWITQSGRESSSGGVLQTPQQELNAVFTVADSFGECEGWRMLKKGAAAACSNTTIVELQW